MKASIYISSNAIKLLVYMKSGSGIKVREYYSYPLPDETVLGGVILDPFAVTEGIRTLKSQCPGAFKDVSLVIDGSFIYTRRISVPGRLSQGMYRRLIRDEFSDVATDAPNLICDYIFLKGHTSDGTSKEILAFGIETSNAMSYIELFSAAGVQLSSIRLGVRTLLHYIARYKELGDTAFVLNVVDEEQMLSIIFQNRTSVFQQRTRLFPDATGSSAQSMLDGLFGIVSFNKSQNFSEITHSYYLGANGPDVSTASSMSRHPEIHFSVFDVYRNTPGAEQLPPDAYFVFLNAVMPDSERDIFSSMKAQRKEKKRDRPKNYYLPIVACLILLFGAAVGYLLLQTYILQRDIGEIQDFLNAPSTIEALEEIDRLDADTARISALYSSADTNISHAEAQPQVSMAVIYTALSIGSPDIRILSLSFNSNNGILSVSAAAPTMHDASSYVERLRREDIIYDVYYTGYRVTAAGEFVFTIEVIKEIWRTEVSADD